ncbi:Tetraspanin family [Nesidiocoris tenuis]|uniref:Tetraspanin n=1 Tax=Nesidiocoris tenuis TaxID=355587 RepID=A0ABN7AVK6_9HEMI|nr:Tetraspanin family [Nesidiocoris tenuis]
MQPMKVTLLFFNGLFFIGGGGLLGLALWVGFSEDLDSMFRLLPTSLPYPMLYYVALACSVSGLLCSALALVSFFAMASFNMCLLAAYIFGLVVMLIMETTAVIFLSATPHYVGIEIDPDTLIDMWQRNYGVPGKERYTASVDIIQTEYGCCGVENGNEFSTSWWLLRELAAQGLVVPLSCCVQDHHEVSYFDPVPMNKTACQDKNPEVYRHARHIQGCLKPLRGWVCQQVTTALNIGGGVIAFQLLLLLFAIIAAVKLKKTTGR